MFEPKTPLEAAIHAGDVSAVRALLRVETPEQRAVHRAGLVRMVKLVQEARWRQDPDGWGSRPTREQQRGLDAAIVLCGTTADVVEAWVDDDVLVAVGIEFSPRSLDGLAEALLRRSPEKIRTVQRLIVAGLAERPDSDDYALGLIALPHVTRDANKLAAMFAADPGLRAALPRVFDVEGTGDISLSSSDKYSHPSLAWGPILLALVDDGLATRAQLLDRTLDALERDWPQYRAGWFSRFHAQLAPTDAELQPRLQRYLALCASRIAPTVTLALAVLKQLDTAAPIDGERLLDALRPVLASTVKTQVEAALKLADRAVAREPRLAPQAADVAAMGLLHEAAPVQATVLARLVRWGVDDALRARLDGLAAGLAATNRAALQLLLAAPDALARESDVSMPSSPVVDGHGPVDPTRRRAPCHADRRPARTGRLHRACVRAPRGHRGLRTRDRRPRRRQSRRRRTAPVRTGAQACRAPGEAPAARARTPAASRRLWRSSPGEYRHRPARPPQPAGATARRPHRRPGAHESGRALPGATGHAHTSRRLHRGRSACPALAVSRQRGGDAV
jgi:hypothetical protein